MAGSTVVVPTSPSCTVHTDEVVVVVSSSRPSSPRKTHASTPRAANTPAITGAIRGGDATYNAEVVRRLLAGETGAVRDAALLNAGAALAVYDAPGEPVADALAVGLARAIEAVDSGAAAATLDRWVAATAR